MHRQDVEEQFQSPGGSARCAESGTRATGKAATPPSSWRRDVLVLALLLACGAAALSIDVTLSRLMIKDDVLHALHQTLEALEPFGHPVAILLILAAIFACDAASRKSLPRVALTMVAGGLVANLFKLLVARTRPYHYDFTGGALDTFQGFLPGVGGGSQVQSFPSAHVATAVAAALALGTVFPNGRRVFAAIASLVALHRIQTGAHYLSDTVWGTAAGYLGWMLLYRAAALGGWFDRRERTWFPAADATTKLPFPVPAIPAHRSREAAQRRDHDILPLTRQVEGLPRHAGSVSPAARLTFGRFQRLSVVVPIYDERDNVPLLHAELSRVLETLSLEYEMVLVDDGSNDGSSELLHEIASRDATVRLVTFRSNLGQAAALAAGIERATGDVIATLDADLQNDPRDLPHLLTQLARGCDVVHGWRKQRRDRLLDRRLPSMIANRLISLVSGYRVHDTGCTLKVMRADLARRLPLFQGMHRFIPALAHALGGVCVEMVVAHRAREFGESKYGLSRTLRVLADLPRLWFVTRFLKGHTRTLHAIAATAARPLRRDDGFVTPKPRKRAA